MWQTGTDYKQKSIENYSQPTFKARLYDDTFTIQGTFFGSSCPFAPAGTFLGNSTGFKFYDTNQKINFAEIGTSYVSPAPRTLTDQGARTDGTKLYYLSNASGTWTSPIITPYYNATWDKCFITDSYNEDLLNSNLIFSENFESWENFTKNHFLFNTNAGNGIGTIVLNNNSFGGLDGKSLFIANYNLVNPTAHQTMWTQIRNNNLFPSDFGNFGEISVDLNFPQLSIAENFPIYYSLGPVLHYVIVEGSKVSFYNSSANTVIGTVGAENKYNLTYAWNMVGTNIIWNTWLNNYKTTGTILGTRALGTVSYFRIGVLASGIYTALSCIDNVKIYGTRIHTSAWTGDLNYLGVRPQYFIRTGTDGTNFTPYHCFSGTNTEYDTTDKNYAYKMGTLTGKYAQFQIAFPGTVSGGTASVTSFAPHCYKDVYEDEVVSVSDIERRIDNDSKIGLIEGNDFNLVLNNSTGTFIGESKTDIQDNPLFYNRPLLVNSPVNLTAGFGGSTGTEYVPTAYGYVTNYNVSQDNLNISLRVSDPWAVYGDLQAGTLTGVTTIGSIVQHFCDFNNIPRNRQKIENISTSFGQIGMRNSIVDGGLTTGGFNNYWDALYFPLNIQRNGFGTGLRFFSQTYDNNNGAGFRDAVGWRKYSSNGLYEDALKVQDFPGAWQEGFCFGYGEKNTFIYLVGAKKGYDYHYFYGWQTREGNIIKNTYGAQVNTIVPQLGTVLMRGLMFDNAYSNDKVRDLCFDNGTAKLADLNLNQNTLDLTWAGNITTLGTFSPFSICVIPQPVSTYNGTAAYYYLISGTESNGNKYIYKYSTGASPAYIDKVQVGSIYRSMFYRKIDNLIYLYGITRPALDATYSSGANASFVPFESDDCNVYKIGLFGMDTQHRPITNPTVYINNTASTGTFVKVDGTAGKILFDGLYTNTDVFSISYDVPAISATAPGTNATFKSAIQSLANLAMGVAYFDAAGNFVMRNKLYANKVMNLATDGVRAFNNSLDELTITGNASQDVNKVKNQITVIGTQNYKTINIDLTSQAIYGTRKMADYTNQYISSQADVYTYGTSLLSYLKDAKTYIDVSMPFHPELEVMDGVDFTDRFNGVSVQGARIKSTKLSFKNFTTGITAEGKTNAEK